MYYGPARGTSHATSGVVKDSSGYVHALYLTPTTTNPGPVEVRDGGASGTVVFEINLDNGIVPPTMTCEFPRPVECKTDIYIVVPASMRVTVLFE